MRKEYFDFCVEAKKELKMVGDLTVYENDIKNLAGEFKKGIYINGRLVPIDNNIYFKAKELEAQSVIDESESKIKAERTKLLKDGALTKDGKLWFNEDVAKLFLQKASSYNLINESLPESEVKHFRWKDKDRKEIILSVEELANYSSEIIDTLDNIYLDMY